MIIDSGLHGALSSCLSKMNSVLYLFLLLTFTLSNRCSALKLRSIQLNMYITSSFDYCMRYVTQNTITGCSSHRSGNRGRLMDVSTLVELHNLATKKHLHPMILLLPAHKDLLDFAISHASFIVGILIDGKTMNTTIDHFTEVSKCPENIIGSSPLSSTSSCSIRKNRFGIDFRGLTIDKPIFLLTNETAIAELRTIIHQYNDPETSNVKRIDAHMKSYAFSVKDAETCIRRSKSTFLGDAFFKHYSIKCRTPVVNIVWATLNAVSIKNTRPPKSVIVFLAKSDFFSVFQPKNAGAQSTAFGVVTLLGLAWALGRANVTEELLSSAHQKDVVLLLVDGENWNYQGSTELSQMIAQRRFPYTVDKSTNQNNLHPIEPEHIDIIVSLDQLGLDDKNMYVLHDNITLHPFLEKLRTVSTPAVTVQHIADGLLSLGAFRTLNINTLAMLTNAYENMNPFYNSYRDILENVPSNIRDYSTLANIINSLLKTICAYWTFATCTNGLTIELQKTLGDRIDAMFHCFLANNCSNLVADTVETGAFYFKGSPANMKQNFSFVQPVVHHSDVKAYLNTQFLDASVYLHNILLNWLAVRTTNTNFAECQKPEVNVFRSKFYQQSTETCLRVSSNFISLIQSNNDPIDDRTLFTSNQAAPELLVYMTVDKERDIIALVCGIVLLISGLTLTYFLTALLPVINAKKNASEAMAA